MSSIFRFLRYEHFDGYVAGHDFETELINQSLVKIERASRMTDAMSKPQRRLKIVRFLENSPKLIESDGGRKISLHGAS